MISGASALASEEEGDTTTWTSDRTQKAMGRKSVANAGGVQVQATSQKGHHDGEGTAVSGLVQADNGQVSHTQATSVQGDMKAAGSQQGTKKDSNGNSVQETQFLQAQVKQQSVTGQDVQGNTMLGAQNIQPQQVTGIQGHGQETATSIAGGQMVHNASGTPGSMTDNGKTRGITGPPNSTNGQMGASVVKEATGAGVGSTTRRQIGSSGGQVGSLKTTTGTHNDEMNQDGTMQRQGATLQHGTNRMKQLDNSQVHQDQLEGQYITTTDSGGQNTTLVSIRSDGALPQQQNSGDNFKQGRQHPQTNKSNMTGAVINIEGQMVVGQTVGGQIIGGQHVGGQIVNEQMVGGQMINCQMVGGQMVVSQMITDQMVGGQIINGQIVGGQTINDQMIGGQMVGGQIINDQMVGGQIVKGQIAGGQMVGGQMVGGQIFGGQVAGGQMVGGQILGGQIAGGQMVSNQMVGGQMIISQMAGGQMVGGQMVNGQMVGGQLVARQIAGGQIAGGQMSSQQINGSRPMKDIPGSRRGTGRQVQGDEDLWVETEVRARQKLQQTSVDNSSLEEDTQAISHKSTDYGSSSSKHAAGSRSFSSIQSSPSSRSTSSQRGAIGSQPG
jgi:hypothetical protein